MKYGYTKQAIVWSLGEYNLFLIGNVKRNIAKSVQIKIRTIRGYTSEY